MDFVHFNAPYWLLLIPLFLFAGWYYPRLKWRNPWRAILLLILTLALADPVLRMQSRSMDLFLLVDRSLSVDHTLENQRHEWEALVRRGQGSDNQLRIIDFAADVLEREDWMPEPFDGRRELTRLRAALEYSASLIDRRRPTRFLVFTDGYATEPLTGLGEQFSVLGIPVDYRLIGPAGEEDYAVRRLLAPGPVRTGEAYMIEGWVEGSRDIEIPYVVFRDGERFVEGTVPLQGGRGLVRIMDRQRTPGARQYRLEILPETDALEGNNRARAWVEVRGQSGVLLISPYADDPVGAALQQAGMEVRLLTHPTRLHEASLQGIDTLILNNVPAEQLPMAFLDSIPFAVEEQGTGFMMLGGKGSFGSGGYDGSALERLLPVSLEMKEEHRRVAVALALVLDRSGSMGAPVGGGLTKMDLANNGAAQAVDLLGDLDAVTVFVVDTAPHTIVPLTQIGANRAEIERRIRSMQSMGGGIFVYTGLKAAWEELQKAERGQKHIILFADAADAEEPGQYEDLLDEITGAGATVSVIGLGRDTDVDAEFLQDVAARGNGRIFFSDDPGQLPALFAQETMSVARATFVQDPVATQVGAGWGELSPFPIAWPSQVEAYNVGYYKPGTSLILATDAGDESGPLAAFQHLGQGRTAAVLFPMAGPFSEGPRAWEHYGDFISTLTRWTAAEETAEGLGLRMRRAGTMAEIDFFYDHEWEPQLARHPPEILVAGARGEVERGSWHRMAPGHFRMSMEMDFGETYRGVVQAGGELLNFGPFDVGVEAEWEMDPERRRELAALARFTGGTERLNLDEAWEPPPVRGEIPLLPWLVVTALILTLVEVTLWRLRGGS